MSHVPVLLGGAALTRTYVERDLRQVYGGRVFYGKDAFEGLRVLDRLGELRRGDEEDPTFGREISERKVFRRIRGDAGEAPEGLPSRSPDVEDDNPIFTPPFLGSRVAKGMSVDEISEYLNLTALFRNQWGFRPGERRGRPGLQRTRQRDAARAVGDRQGGVAPRAPGGLGSLRRGLGGQRPHPLRRRHPHAPSSRDSRSRARPSRPSSASPTSSVRSRAATWTTPASCS